MQGWKPQKNWDCILSFLTELEHNICIPNYGYLAKSVSQLSLEQTIPISVPCLLKNSKTMCNSKLPVYILRYYLFNK